ncbi:hypothetical protein FA014_02025 [Cellulomonas hominis]|uniref:HTH araC/xylS-type domain-containing protein n=1 Tax=Cellulomonas hominis TaxID=156981 RepID=A0A7Z8K3F6_9CELL|nr:hypothetical protein [Cellulomonas hominis]TKR27158.1 hypothetical protein FA014_02025 [Cellulomonas hominis]
MTDTTTELQPRARAVVEDAEWLVATGECWTQAAHRLGYGSPKSLERVLYRLGRGDLVSALKAHELSPRQMNLHRSPHAA